MVTTGIVTTNPNEHAISRIAGEVTFSFEARSLDLETVRDFHDAFEQEMASVSAERGVTFSSDRGIFTAPARMSSSMIKRACSAAVRLGMKQKLLPSGAGHDAAIFANAGVPSGLIFVRNRNGSHNPAESMELEDFSKGVALLEEIILGFGRTDTDEPT